MNSEKSSSSYSVRIVCVTKATPDRLASQSGTVTDEITVQEKITAQEKITVQVNRAQNPTVADLCDALVEAFLPQTQDSQAQSPKTLNITGGAKGLIIDGREFGPHILLDDCPLFEGVEIVLGDAKEIEERVNSSEAGTRSVVAVIGGIDSGQQTSLGVHPVVVGRSSIADLRIDHPEVSQRHLLVEHRRVLDLDSGITLEGKQVIDRAEIAPEQRIGAGNAVVTWRLLEDDNIAGNIVGRPPKLIFNRPPRAHPPPTAEPFRLAGKGSEGSLFPVRAPTWATFVIPLALGLVLAVLFNPYMALFALLGPAMAVSSWLEGRSRNKKDLRSRRRQTTKDREAFKVYSRRAAALEVARRRFEHPDPAASLRWAARLWERSRADADFLHLSVGRFDTSWHPPVEIANGTGKNDQELADFADATTLRDVPFVVDFSKGIIGIVGPRREFLARWLIMQAAVRYGPSDLSIAVSEDWSWTSWLPHTLGSGGSAHTLAVCPHPSRVLVGDSTLVLAETLDELPSDCSTSIQLLDDAGRCRVTHWPHTVLADGVSHGEACYAARHLARLEDPLVTSVGLATTISLTSLLGLQPDISADRVLQEWSRAGMAAPIGCSDDQVIHLDLPSDGPHGLIAGTTGSGKSELMRCLVTSLAFTTSPESLNFVLIDYKGGSAFDACAGLPHVVGMVTDLDERLGERALVCLRAELAYREQFLRNAQASSIGELSPASLPRLLVVIDEFAALASELPSFLESLVDIAQRGRSLGVHLLLGTQRPAGVVSPSIRSNTNIRIGLRMLDPHDSEDVIGTPAAAAINQNSPGRAFVRYGSSQPIPFQVAAVSGITPSPSDKPVLVKTPLCNWDEADKAEGAETEKQTDLQQLVTAIDKAWTQTGSSPLRCPWPEPLPTKLDIEDLRACIAAAGENVGSADMGIALGLEDHPEEQMQSLCLWYPKEKNLLLIGLAGSGASETLMMAVLQLAQTRQPDALHIYGIDYGANNIAQLAGLPHCEAIFGPAEVDQRTELLDFLFDELAKRQSEGSQILTILLIDNLGALLHALEDERDYRRIEKLTRLYLDGPSWGITTVIVAESLAAVPRKFFSAATMRLLFRVSDSSPYGAADTDTSKFGFGRALMTGGVAGGISGGISAGISGGMASRGNTVVEVQTAVVSDFQKAIANIVRSCSKSS